MESRLAIGKFFESRSGRRGGSHEKLRCDMDMTQIRECDDKDGEYSHAVMQRKIGGSATDDGH
jgi:hypothetical protein